MPKVFAERVSLQVQWCALQFASVVACEEDVVCQWAGKPIKYTPNFASKEGPTALLIPPMSSRHVDAPVRGNE